MAKKTSLELAVDSGRWDAGLRKAQTELNRFIQTQGGLEAAMKADSQAMTEFIGMMGNMESTAKTARGQVNEYRNTIEQLSRTYNQLSASEKNSDIGRALSQSIEQLTGRMRDAQNEMRNTSQLMGEQKNAGGELGNMLDGIAGKFGISTKALTVWGAALAGVTAALNVAKDAFLASESSVDEWGRVMASSKSVYDGFLISLNTGDISGFLSRIDQIVQAARTAYDELDRLGTMRTIQGPATSAQMTENERMRTMIRTGRYVAPIDGRKPAMENGQLLTPEQIRSIERQLQNGMQNVVGLVGNEVKQTGRAIDAVYDRMAKELGMSVEEFRKGTSSMAEFDKRLAGASKYKEWEKQNSSSSVGMSGGLSVYGTGGNNPYSDYKGWSVFRVDGDKFNELVSLIKQRDQQTSQAYSMQQQAFQAINRAEGISTRKLLEGDGTRGGTARNGGRGALDVSKMAVPGLDAGDLQFHGYATTQSMADMQQQLQQYQKALKDATTQAEWEAATEGVTRMKALIEAQPFALKMGVDADTVVAWREEAQARMDEIEPIKIGMVVEQTGAEGLNKGKEVAKDWNMAAGAIRDVGHALSGLDDPAARVMGTIAQAIASVALGYGQAMSAKDSTASGWAWLGFAATATATMLSSIAAIRNATAGSYAQGGIVPGTDWHDGLTANVSSGELILNQAQQGNLASQLRNDVGGGAQGSVVRLRGEDLWFAISTHLRRVGKGEIINLTTH